jgi:hypothetical protein
MHRQIVLTAILVVVSTSTGSAAESERLTVTSSPDSSVFYQIESSGRKNIAATNEQVGLVWEEIRKGKSTSYAVFKNRGDTAFGTAIALDASDAFSPVIANCANLYYLAWITDDAVKVSTYRDAALGRPETVATGPINELTIACAGDSALLAWSQRQDRGYSVWATRVSDKQGRLQIEDSLAVAPADKYRFQTNPGAAFAKGRIVITWHDRTTGTNLLYATSGEKLSQLGDPVQINELIKKSYEWGSGSSGVRNALAVGEKGRLVAVWLDKRASRSGYKVYSAFSNDGGVTWGDNYNIIDEWGEIVPQWTPAVASNGKDKLLAVWMDTREEENIIWMSKLDGMSWSSNLNLSGDSAGDPHSPVIAFSPDGTLHAAWIEKQNGGALIRYYSR